MLVTGTVKVVAARSITSLRMSDTAAVWVLDAAGWAAAAVEATGLSIEQGRLPRARMSFKQDFRDLRDFRNKTPTPVPHEKLTHEQLGSRTVLRLAVVSTGLGMQHGATGEFTFVGEYAPIAIYTKGLAVSMYMLKTKREQARSRHGHEGIREARPAHGVPPRFLRFLRFRRPWRPWRPKRPKRPKRPWRGENEAGFTPGTHPRGDVASRPETGRAIGVAIRQIQVGHGAAGPGRGAHGRGDGAERDDPH